MQPRRTLADLSAGGSRVMALPADLSAKGVCLGQLLVFHMGCAQGRPGGAET